MRFYDLLKEYNENKINEKSFYDNIRQIFNEYLHEHKFAELEYLKIYPFISVLLDKDIYLKNILKDEIKEIEDIFSGKMPFSYCLWMCVEKCDMESIHSVLSEYKEKGKISFDKYESLEEKLSEIQKDKKTIQDICWEKLLNLIVGLPTLDDDIYMWNSLYSGKIDKSIICKEIERLIDILEGKRAVYLSLIYDEKGFFCVI